MMDYYQNTDNQDPSSQRPVPKTSGFSTASLVCGIISVSLCCTGILGIPCGSLSILFASLSKRKDQKMPGRSKSGLSLGIVGIALGLLITATSVYLLFTEPAVQEQFNVIMEELYGMNMEEYLDSLF